MNKSGKIQRYLDGELSDEEIQSFREELMADPHLREETELYKLVDDSLRNRDIVRFRRKLKEAYEQYELFHSNNKSSKNSGIKRVIYLAASMAAITILAIIFLFPGKEYNKEDIFNSSYAPFKVDLISRNSISANRESLLADGIGNYIMGNYSKSAANLGNYLLSGPEDSITALFYLGLCSIENQNFNLAKDCFRKVMSDDFNYYQEHAKWYLGLVYIKENDLKPAIDIYTSISKTTSVYSRESSELLKKISRIK